LLGPERFEG